MGRSSAAKGTTSTKREGLALPGFLLTVVFSAGLHGGALRSLWSYADGVVETERQGDRSPSLTEVDVEPAANAPSSEVAVEATATPSRENAPSEGEPPRERTGTSVERIDLGPGGRGGQDQALARAVHASSDRDEMTRVPDLRNHLLRNQVQRLRTGPGRASWENRRATPRPMELTLVTTGPGKVLERGPLSPFNPNRGLEASKAAAVRGGASTGTELAVLALPEEDSSSAHGQATVLGGSESASGLGSPRRPPGDDHRRAVAMATARPSLKEGPVATQAWEKARPKDNVDTEQAVAEAVQSLVHASTLGAQRLAEGEGGEGAGTTAGAGGLTEGSKAQRLGIASRETIDFGTTDPRYLTYFRKLHARIDPLWQEAFPKAALVEGKQGTVILEFVVKNTGALEVVWPPLRPSGIDEFDRRCAEALRRAGPVDPIPPSLGTQALRIRAPFVAKNPAVH